jgi:ArsR family transcriptional regulator
MSANLTNEAELLKAMGHPVRLRIVIGLLSCHYCNVNDIVEKLKLPQSTVSQQLAVLRSRGIIAPRKEGVKTCYHVVDKRAAHIAEFLKK